MGTELTKVTFPDTNYIDLNHRVSNVAWDSTNKKLTQTFGKTTTDIVTGETILDPLIPVKTASGSLVSFSDGADLPMPSFICNIDAVQDLHGYDAPWVGGAGKNKLKVTATSRTVNGVTFTVNADGSVTAVASSKRPAHAWFPIATGINISAGSILSGGKSITIFIQIIDSQGTQLYRNGSTEVTIAEDLTNVTVRLGVYSEVVSQTYTFLPMIRTSGDSSFAPYSNICPISGHTGVDAVISPTTEASAGTTYSVSWQTEAGEVFGGYVDLVSGVLTVTHKSRTGFTRGSQDSTNKLYAIGSIADMKIYTSSSNISPYFIDSMFEKMSLNGARATETPSITQVTKTLCVGGYIGKEAELDTLLGTLQVKYELETPLTYQLTPTQIKSLLGYNNAWCSTGDVNVKYITQPYDGISAKYSEYAYNALNKTGDTMTGDLTLYMEGTTNKNDPTRLIFQNKDTTTDKTSTAYINAYNGAENGANLVIHPGGNLFIGAGEAATNHYALYKHSSTEHFYATSDNNIYLQGNGQTIANRKGLVINTSHEILPCAADVATNKIGSIGNATYKWGSMYTTRFNQIITGSGTAAQDKGKNVSPRYFPAKWTFNTGLTAADGDIFTIKIPVAGHDYGVFMSIDNGTTYYPIVCNGTGRLTTHYPVNSYITVVFEPNGSAASMMPLNGGDAKETVTGGVWRVINFYDANTNTQVRVCRQTTGYNNDYPLLVSRTLASGIGTAGTNDSYSQVYGVMWNDTTKIPTLNPSTGQIKAYSLTVGTRNGTVGTNSFAQGLSNVGSGSCSHAEGYKTTAGGDYSHSEGSYTYTNGAYSHAEGASAYTGGNYAHAEGYSTTANGNYSHAEGENTKAIGGTSHAEGSGTYAAGTDSHAEGYYTKAAGNYAHSSGQYTTANGSYSHTEGQYSYTVGNATHAEGSATTAYANYSHAEGQNSYAAGFASHTEGNYTTASGSYSHAEGTTTLASTEAAHAEGNMTRATGPASHAEGAGTTAKGIQAHAEGAGSLADGNVSHAEGAASHAQGNYSHSEGAATWAYGQSAHAEGLQTTAWGAYSHAEGLQTSANGDASHAEGNRTGTYQAFSHAEGYYTYGMGIASHAEGYYTTATHKSQHVFGEYNALDAATSTSSDKRGTYVEIVGNGTASTALSNARTLDWDGNESLGGSLNLGASGDINLATGETWATHRAITSLKTAIDAVDTDAIYWRSIPGSGVAVNGTIDLSPYMGRTKFFLVSINAAKPSSSYRSFVYVPAHPSLVSYYTFHDGTSYGYVRIEISSANVLKLLSISKSGYKIEYILY